MTSPTLKIPGEKGDLIPQIGLGCMGLNSFYITDAWGNTEQNLKCLKEAYDLGATHWDTSDIYGVKKMGENEELIGKAIQELKLPREKLFLATKFGYVMGQKTINGSPSYVPQAFINSSKTLGTDYVDIYYLHRVSAETPVEETVKAMDDLRKEGKVRYLGLSECSADTLRRASKVARIDFIEIEYSLFCTDIETDGVLDACKELDITVSAYAPLGRGFLTGSIKKRDDLAAKDFRMADPRFSEENFPKNLALVDYISKLAQDKGCTNSQLALAWILAQGEARGVRIVTIPGTTKAERVRENVGAAQIKLTNDELTEIRKTLDSIPVVGNRYSPGAMKLLGR